MNRTLLTLLTASALLTGSTAALAGPYSFKSSNYTGERSYGYVNETEAQVPWEKLDVSFRIPAMDVGRPGAIFIIATANTERMMAFTPEGWIHFPGGLIPATAYFEALDSGYSVELFNTEIIRTNSSYFLRKIAPTGQDARRYGLNGDTVCIAAGIMGVSRLAIVIGHGVVTQEAEETVARIQELGIPLEPNHVRHTYVIQDMYQNEKFGQVMEYDCADANQPFGVSTPPAKDDRYFYN